MNFRSYKKILSNQVSGFCPESDWKKSSREALLAQIRQTKVWQQPEESSFFGSAFSAMFARHMLKPVLAGFLVFTTIIYSSIFTVQTAKASLPGDMIYPVKLGIENVRVGLVFSESKKAELEVQFAGTRLEEVKEVIGKEVLQGLAPEITKQNKKEVQRDIKKAIQEFSENIGSVQKRLEKIEIEQKSSEKVLEISKLVNEKTTELEQDLIKIKEKIIEKPVVSEPIIAEVESIESVINESTDIEETVETIEEIIPTDEIQVKDQYIEVLEATETATGTTSNQLALDEESDQEDEDFLESIEIALDTIDKANTKSLEVFVVKASESNNENTKQNAVEKLQSKIEKVEKDITNVGDKITKITEKSTTQNMDEQEMTVNKDEDSDKIEEN